MNDRKIADAVNEIRDMAVKYRDTQQLRDRIASLMTTILRAQDVARAPLTDEQRIAIQECIGYLTPAAKEFSDLGLPGMGDSKHARCIRTRKINLSINPAGVLALCDEAARLSQQVAYFEEQQLKDGRELLDRRARIAALKSELAEEKETRRAYEEECQATCAEGIKYWKDRLESQLAARESAEPVAWLTEDGRIAKDETKQCMPSASRENFTIPLFAHPPAAVASEPEWIVNDLGELGVKVGDRFFFLYKGENIEYGTDEVGDVRDGIALHEDGTPMQYRIVGKREFGEVCYPLKWIIANRSEHRYTDTLVYTPGLSLGNPGDGDWKPLPAAIAATKEKEHG